ncbi:PAS domain-containing protein (plasmid) [Pseudoalteromonas sp. T1lg65]|uniref:PAS domain-containing protein n=1 Tax=Pseudoalteromonas sp. T1lg65 TaxID=2077101 RepID=UPI003F79A90B
MTTNRSTDLPPCNVELSSEFKTKLPIMMAKLSELVSQYSADPTPNKLADVESYLKGITSFAGLIKLEAAYQLLTTLTSSLEPHQLDYQHSPETLQLAIEQLEQELSEIAQSLPEADLNQVEASSITTESTQAKPTILVKLHSEKLKTELNMRLSQTSHARVLHIEEITPQVILALNANTLVLEYTDPHDVTQYQTLLSQLKASQHSLLHTYWVAPDNFQTKLMLSKLSEPPWLSSPTTIDYLAKQIWFEEDLTASLKVMLVGACLAELQAYQLLLKHADIEVFIFTDIEKAYYAVEALSPDVLLLDMDMPQNAAIDMSSLLFERCYEQSLALVFMSLYTKMEDQLHALRLGSVHFVSKPVIPERLISLLKACGSSVQLRKEQGNEHNKALYERELEHFALNKHAIVSIADRKGNIIYVNNLFCEISGYSKSELIGSNHRIVKSHSHTKSFFEDMWKTIAHGNVWQGEVCNRKKHGQLYWVKTTIVPFLDDKGRPYQYISIRTDVTQSKLQENALMLLSEFSYLKPEVYIKHLARMVAQAMNVDIGFIALEDYRLGELSLTCDIWDTAGRIKDIDHVALCGLCREAYDNETSYYECNANAVFHHFEVLQEQSIEAYVILPLKNSSDEVIGYMGGMHREPLEDGISVMALLQLFVTQLEKEISTIETKQEIETHKERLRRGQIYADIGTWELNIQTGFLYGTERIAPLFGYQDSETEFNYELFLASIHPEDKTAVKEAIEACIEHDIPYEIEHRVIWPDGTVRWLLEKGAVKRDNDGQPLQMLVVVQDIDARKRAELMLAERDAQLQKAQAIAKVGSWTIELTTGKGICSNETYRILDRRKDTFQPSLRSFIKTIYPEDRANVVRNYLLGLKSGHFDENHRLVTTSNEIRHVHVLGEVEYDQANNPIKVQGTIQDITKEAHYQEALIKATQEAQKANKAKSEFLSSMSHELRTPMNAILGFTQLLQIDGSLTEDQQDSLNEITVAGKHLLELINEVLDLSKIESGKVTLSIEAININTLIDECLRLVLPLATAKNITIDVNNYAESLISADKMRTKQVLLNLLSNAVKYNAPSGQVEISITESEQCLCVTVSDTGFGIAPELIDDLFKPFNRLTEEHSDIEGTGIGLTITKKLMTLMGGSIEVDSEVGVGSKFSVFFPTVQSSADSESLTEQTFVKPEEASTATAKILYIEDNPANIKLVQQIINRMSECELFIAQQPTLGLEMATACKPDLILLDINLPGVSGFDLIHDLRKIEGNKQTPIIAVTANAMANDIQRAKEAGFADYITKPIDVPKFLSLIHAQLQCQHDAPNVFQAMAKE